MTDLSRTVAPKSDQLNADDLIAGPRTITVTRVTLKDGDDQPVAIYFEGDGGKPYKPCKSMRRVLMRFWGNQGSAYAGRQMTLFRDDSVLFGGVAVGGIRISHISGIERATTFPLTVAKARRALFTVKPIAEVRTRDPRPEGDDPKSRLFAAAREKAKGGQAVLGEWHDRLKPAQVDALQEIAAELDQIARNADATGDGNPGGMPAHGDV